MSIESRVHDDRINSKELPPGYPHSLESTLAAAGQRLRARREGLGLTLRDVEAASAKLAAENANEEFYLAVSRIADIETRGVVPNAYRLFALSVILRLPLGRLLSLYGIPAAGSPSGRSRKRRVRWDAFISHASEDKDILVRPLAAELKSRGASIWFDEFELKVGDSLRQSIEEGLRYSHFGIVVLSANFFAKDWPQRELDGLVSREKKRNRMILPIWHQITRAQVAGFSLILADRLAAQSTDGVEVLADKLIAAMRSR